MGMKPLGLHDGPAVSICRRCSTMDILISKAPSLDSQPAHLTVGTVDQVLIPLIE
jgi:hypothetical protein